MSLFPTHGGHFSHVLALSCAVLAWQLCTVWSSHRSCPSCPSAVEITATQRNKAVGCVVHLIMLHFHDWRWELCTHSLLRAELQHPQPHTSV